MGEVIGLTRRRLYKPERAPARMQGILRNEAPLACLDACQTEITSAIAAILQMGNALPGIGREYDAIRDQYTITGKSGTTGKAQDYVIEGEAVAAVIHETRRLNGGKYVKGQLAKAMGY